MAAADQADLGTEAGRSANPTRRLVERALLSTCGQLLASSHCQAPTEVESRRMEVWSGEGESEFEKRFLREFMVRFMIKAHLHSISSPHDHRTHPAHSTFKGIFEGHHRADASPLVTARNAVVKALILEIVSSCVLWASSWRGHTGHSPVVLGAPSLPSHVMTDHLFVLLQLLSDAHPMVRRAAKEALRSLSVSQGNEIGHILLCAFLHCHMFSISTSAVIALPECGVITHQ